MTNLALTNDNLIYDLLYSFKQYLIISEDKKESTTKTYGVSIRQYLSYFGDNWLNPSREECEEYKIYLLGKYKMGTVRTKLAAIKKLFKYLKNTKKIIIINPWESIGCGKNEVESLVRKVNFEESAILTFINNIPNIRIKLLFHTVYQTGGRISEILNLKWSDIYENIISIRISKTKSRDIDVNPKLINDLRQLKGNSDYIFCTSSGKQLSRVYAHTQLKKYADKQGFDPDFSCHWLRHNSITNIARNGGTPEMINKVGGWAEGSQMWQRYQNVINIPDTSKFLSY